MTTKYLLYLVTLIICVLGETTSPEHSCSTNERADNDNSHLKVDVKHRYSRGRKIILTNPLLRHK